MLALSLKMLFRRMVILSLQAACLATFIESERLPLPVEIKEALEVISLSLSKLRQEVAPNVTDALTFRRFEDAGKSLKHMIEPCSITLFY